MTFTDSFDDFNSTERQLDNIDQPPFQFREKKDEDSTHEWLLNNYDNCERAAHSRRITYRRYQALYKNIHWRFFDTRDTRRDMEYTNKRPRHSVNFVREMVDSKVAQNSRLKANLAFIPWNDESSDVNNAKACKLMYDARAEEIDLEKKHQEQDKTTFLFGHSAMFIEWDEDAGPEHPAYIKLKQEYPDGIPAKILKQLMKEESIRIGDVSFKVYGPDRFYPELNKENPEDLDHVEKLDYIHIDTVRAMYPKKASEVMENSREIYDFDSSELIRPKNLVTVRTFYHRPTKFFPEGAKIVYCDDCILEWTEYPYSHGMLPCIFDKDLEIYGEFWGRSFLQDIEQLQRFYNNIQSSQARDYSWASAPKWMMPKGSCNVTSLNNDLTIVEFTGPVAPQLVTHNPTPPQAFQLQEHIEKKITQHSNVYDISRGEVPTGVTANSALRFLDEQESQRILVQETKRKRRVISVAKMALEVMKQYYKPNDGRTVRILGKNNEYMIKSFQSADFTKVYDVKPVNSSALPDTKAGKISTIIDLNTATQTDPIFRKEEIIQMLDLGNEEYYVSRATVSVNAANMVLDSMLNGEAVPSPEACDDLMVYYSVFDKAIQQPRFKTKVDPQIKNSIAEYIKTLEYLMFERAKVNMKFAMELSELDNYPMYFRPEISLLKLIAMLQMDAQGVMPQQNPSMKTDKVENLPEQKEMSNEQ